MEQHTRYDVLVVGFGPSGAVAAGLLGQLGYRTRVIDRLADIYDRPRAIALDHEIMRLFDNMGIAADVQPYVTPFTVSEHFGARGQLIRRIDMVQPPYPMGYTPSMVFTQPPVEAALRRHAQSFDSVSVALSTELIDLVDNGEDVLATLRDSQGQTSNVRARYVIGCDGASSTVRRLAGIALEDLVFDEPWLVVDVKVEPHALAGLPQNSAQFCDPARPASYIVGPGNHRRWEIMLLPGEDPLQMAQPDAVWPLLSKWLTPEDGELWRAAAYRFHALVADDWRRGRVFIAGDAAHQQPPFIGQGMCQGLRDVANLLWKLDRVMRGQSSPRLLDSYTVERKRHVRTLTGKIKAIGQTICERDPQAAHERDASILAAGNGQPLTVTRQDIVPPLEAGLLAADSPAKGMLFPQPAVRDGHGRRLMDQIAGTGWRLVVDGRRVPHAEVAGLAAAVPGLRLISVVAAHGFGDGSGDARAASDVNADTDADSDVLTVHETDGVVAAWFDRHSACAAWVRPDHYVYGVAVDMADLSRQSIALQTELA